MAMMYGSSFVPDVKAWWYSNLPANLRQAIMDGGLLAWR